MPATSSKPATFGELQRLLLEAEVGGWELTDFGAYSKVTDDAVEQTIVLKVRKNDRP